MAEPLTTQVVATELERLMVAFPRGRQQSSPQQLAEVYRNGLHGLTADALRWAVKTVIQEDQYFPKVARLRELAKRWTGANVGPLADPIGGTDKRCPACHRVPVWERRWRPRLTEDGKKVLDAAGRMWIESYERLRCDCDASCRYAPDAPGAEVMTLPDQRKAS